MRNLISWILGLLALVIVIPSTIPLLGWGNWFALPVLALGVIVGQLAPQKSGRNFNLVVLVVAALRLSIGGGIF
ncbi:MAG: hypothetical protein COW16_07800 [Sphingomonadales bacterium CG12_big_fil_rev_8_21_14_0_65_65_10]|jgi:hypothetical protein|uniref:Uncharacterized protein n=1 Tax=Blastomonas marina TaxID=1867408 RepID=A0ABQ1FFG1_9SPHN|nr:hypothetical protein [Blastomonas marina]PIW55103.1 MAG: hypothetical protein COW16_07800 [Sphingomonadales bacterium CG12_big_fil_rev_8_21_14_0_65_65_10]WPZ02727.1 hypothetical protein T8S45_07645 [Blastomonas marina]GGA07803.1 hypothetical protein GCM10010923_17370 [Blastomonas marina]